MPYTAQNYPAQLKKLPEGARALWIRTFNAVLASSNSEDQARQAAWGNVKEKYKKVGNKWVKKNLTINSFEDDMKKVKTNDMTEVLNNTEDKGLFKAYIPLVQKNGSFIIEKSDGVDQPKSFYLVGEASNTKVDKADDRMSKNFIKSMKTQLQGLNVFAEHEHDIEKTLGYVSNVDGSDDMVVVETALENPTENSLVDKIIKKIAHGTKIYYSVAGKITKAYKKVDEALQKTVREIEDGIIYEVSLTALPEGDVSFVAPIMKSFNLFMKSVDAESQVDDDEIDDDEDEDESSIKKTSEPEVQKALQEMMQSNGISNQIYDLFYTFRQAIYEVTNNNDLKPAEKKDKIMTLADEYAVTIEKLSAELAALTETINEQLSGSDDTSGN